MRHFNYGHPEFVLQLPFTRFVTMGERSRATPR